MSTRTLVRVLIVIFVVAMVGGLLIVGFLHTRHKAMRERPHEQALPLPPQTSVQEGERVILLAADTQEKSGIVVAPLAPSTYQEEISAYGMVLPLQEFLDIRTSYFAAHVQVDKAQAVLNASRQEYERLKLLHTANHNISDKALQGAEASWRADEASLRAAQDALRAVDSAARAQWGEMLAEWLSQSSPALDRLLHQQEVLAQLSVPPGARIVEAPLVAQLQTAEGTVVSAKLLSPSPRTDPRIQGRSFFYLAPAQPSHFLQGMSVLAALAVGPQRRGVLVPGSAVVWWQRKAWVYVQKDPHQFVRREIVLDKPLKEGWFLHDRLQTGELVVVSGAQLLLSEEFRGELHSSEGDAPS